MYVCMYLYIYMKENPAMFDCWRVHGCSLKKNKEHAHRHVSGK